MAENVMGLGRAKAKEAVKHEGGKALDSQGFDVLGKLSERRAKKRPAPVVPAAKMGGI